MGKRKSDDSDIFIATESFTCEIDDEHFAVIKGKTRVREGHPLLVGNRDYFKPVGDDVTYELPGEIPAPEEQTVEVPEGVIPGETPGWPVDETGTVLDLTPEQREELAKAELDGGGEHAPDEDGTGTEADSQETGSDVESEKPKPRAARKPRARRGK